MTYPSLDPADQQLLATLKEEGATPGSTPDGTLPTEGNEPTDATAAAPAPAADAPAPAPAPSPEATATPAAPAPDATTAPAAPAAAPAPAEPQQPQGDPRAALRASRANERRLRNELDARTRELEELRTKAGATADGGNTASTSVADMTPEQLAELEENFPVQAALVREVQQLRKQIPAPTPAPAPNADGWEAPTFNPDVQEVIDQVPQLQAWQYSQADQPKFALASEFDQALMADPRWKGKPPAERFAEATRLTKEHLGIASAPAPSAPAPAPRQDPAAAIAAAPTSQAQGISDFRGGAPAAAPARDYTRMSDEQILASLDPNAS